MSLRSEMRAEWERRNRAAAAKAIAHNATIPSGTKLCEQHDYYLAGMDWVKECRRCPHWDVARYLGNSVIDRE
jgi:hypothetical protein